MTSAFRIVWLGILLIGSLVDRAWAESLPPGTYHEQGRVVLKADGQIAVFWGSFAYLFPKPQQEQLRPYFGRFVEISYTRVGEEPGRISVLGSEFGAITDVEIKALDPDHLPIVCKIQPTKTVYDLSEPVVVHVSVTNRTDKPQSLALGAGCTVSLCQDYERVLALDWLEEYYSHDAPWGLPKGFQQHPVLAAGETMEFDVVSQFMARPGGYQLVYKASGGPASDYGNQSEVTAITVTKAVNPEAEHQALKKWLYRAAYPQRVEIAERLLSFGDSSGTQEILRLLSSGVYSRESHWEPPAFRYAWKHGGKDGEWVMLDLIEKQKRQGVVAHLLEGLCPNLLMPSAPAGAADLSPRREPWEDASPKTPEPRQGRKKRRAEVNRDSARLFLRPCRGWRPSICLYPWLAPWAEVCRPCRGWGKSQIRT